jgi:hypothetical protein
MDTGLDPAGAGALASPATQPPALPGLVEVARLLAERGVELAILETSPDAPLGRALLGQLPPPRITASHVAPDMASLAGLLKLSAAKIDAFGLVSEMVAAEAAAALIDTYEGGWGLVILGNLQPGAGVQGESVVGLGTPSATRVRLCPAAAAPRVALELLREEALARKSSPSEAKP